MSIKPSLGKQCLAEAIGTGILVFLGTGSVYVALLTNALPSVFEVAAVWGLAVTLAIFVTSAVSGAHLNPAVTLALWAWRGFPGRSVGPYMLAQLIGAFVAATALYGLFGHFLADFEQAHNLTRGAPGSQLSAMVMGEYYPNPGMFGTTAQTLARFPWYLAAGAEVIGTGLLVFFVFALTDPRNAHRPDGTLFALFIGLAITALVTVIAPLTQSCLNPARDLGPRLFAFLAGWGTIAIPGPRGETLLYIVAPLVGGWLGGLAYDRGLRSAAAATPAPPHQVATRRPAGDRDEVLASQGPGRNAK